MGDDKSDVQVWHLVWGASFERRFPDLFKAATYKEVGVTHYHVWMEIGKKLETNVH